MEDLFFFFFFFRNKNIASIIELYINLNSNFSIVRKFISIEGWEICKKKKKKEKRKSLLRNVYSAPFSTIRLIQRVYNRSFLRRDDTSMYANFAFRNRIALIKILRRISPTTLTLM